tara:strand:+ start:197 stop:472 length:276 start_codon:yes stop_codon:yes gene_type:complete
MRLFGKDVGQRTMREPGAEEILLDATGLLCPLPVLKARKALKPIASGGRLVILATDPGAVADFQSFCEAQGHNLIDWSENDGEYRFEIQKA